MKKDDITTPLVVLSQPNCFAIAAMASEMFTRST
jgi:hypothetical protein